MHTRLAAAAAAGCLGSATGLAVSAAQAEPPRACCAAMIADCLACMEGVSKEEYCKSNPHTAGCGDEADADDGAESQLMGHRTLRRRTEPTETRQQLIASELRERSEAKEDWIPTLGGWPTGPNTYPAETKTVNRSCREVVYQDKCHKMITWAMNKGMREHPEWYPGLNLDSNWTEYQEFIHGRKPDICPEPCWHVENATARLAQDGAAKPLADVMAITGYWRLTMDDADVGRLRTGPGSYLHQMPAVMTLNTPMAIYGDAFGLENMRKARGNSTPELQSAEEVHLTSLPPCSTHGQELRQNNLKYTDTKNAPSISLGCIWDGKMSLIARTADKHPGYKFYAWLDVGMHAYKYEVIKKHGGRPWPDAAKLATLPTDRVSVDRTFECAKCKRGDWDNFCHCIAATSILVPGSMVKEVSDLFYRLMEECFEQAKGKTSAYTCISEQHILTQMHKEKPGLFNFVDKGYGSMAADLVTQMYESHGSESALFDMLTGEEEGVVTTPL